MLEKTAQLIRTHLPNGLNVLDMYGGAGTLSSLCAEKAKHVTLVEHNRDAVVYAEKNLASLPHSSWGLSGSQWIKTAVQKKFEAVIIDPPRSGMEKDVREYLAHSSIPIILSLSCDPVTQARDCAVLVKNGYTIEKLYALDYYPQTSHIESLAICIKN
jgi:23S rRNA (uracil1939-C5)-methyltransferase